MITTFTYLRLLKYAFFFIVCTKSLPGISQNGCKDPAANNYNASATVNDGSCTYNTIIYTPSTKVDPLNEILTESSTLQWAGNSLWSLNDSRGDAAIYRIDTLSDRIFQTVSLEGATDVDWEEIAFDGTYLYVGDIGNNFTGARTDLKIYKFPFSAIPPDYATHPTATVAAAQIEIINFRYSDQEQPPVPGGMNNTKFDCQAMLVDGGKIHLFTKNWLDNNTTHYVIDNTTAGTYIATPIETLATDYLVTAVTKVPGLNIVAFLGYQNAGVADHFMHLFTDYKDGKYFNGNKRKINLPNVLAMGQAEGITFRNESYGYISNEKFVRTILGAPITITPKLKSFDIAGFVPQYFPVTLPLHFNGLKGFQKNAGIELEWSITAESSIAYFEVEKSVNGQLFTNAAHVNRNQYSTGYSWFDATPFEGNNFYRIKAFDKSGGFIYSQLVVIKTGAGKQVIAVFPNPVINGTVSLQFINQPKGKYVVQVYNSIGQQVTGKTIVHPGGSATQTISLETGAKGVYNVQVSNDITKTVLQITCN